MLTGQPPHVGSTPQATIEAILKGDVTPPSIKRLGAGLTTEVDRVVLKALERSSSRRPLTLRQFLADVAALVVTEQTATNPASGAQSKEPTFAKTMVFAGGAVSAVNYQGPTGGLITAGEQCAYAVDACVKSR